MRRERLVLLIRHGIAHRRGSMPEEKRGLTKTGHQRMREIARALAQLVPAIDALCTSPLLRCRQTAEYLADRYETDVQIAEELRPDADATELRTLLKRIDGAIIACVGHEPTLSAMMLDLTKMKAATPPELKKGGLYALRFAGGTARLEWMLSPKVLRV